MFIELKLLLYVISKELEMLFDSFFSGFLISLLLFIEGAGGGG